jgi:N-acetylmuramoyl-L-alanine amidase
MFRLVERRRLVQLATAISLMAALALPALAKPGTTRMKVKARDQFSTAQKMREALNGTPEDERNKRDYLRVMDAYRRVYYMAPTSSRADASVLAVAELLVQVGRSFEDEKSLRAAIGQYEFLRREYPGSKFRVDALFTIGQIYREDLEDRDKARETFEEFLKHYPHSHLAPDARDAIKEMDAEVVAEKKGKKPGDAAKEVAKKEEPKLKPTPQSDQDDTRMATASAKRSGLPLITGIRHWSTPDYTRVAIDLETEVKYEAGRVPDPDRIFFDLHDTKLASTLVGKTFDVSDGFLKRIRVAQFQRGLTRVVLEVDDVSEYSVFLLPNPYRLIIDIHGRKPQSLLARKTEKKEEKTQPKEETKPTEQAKNTSPEKKVEPQTATPQGNSSATVAKNEPPPTVLPVPVPESSKKASETAKGTSASTEAKAEKKIGKKDEAEDGDGVSTKQEVANLTGAEKKATDKPTSEPTVEVVAPRSDSAKKSTMASKRTVPDAHAARTLRDGDRTLIRALGLKIGKVVVDAGHGGHDTGTIGPNGLLEKDLVLDVALRLGRLLEKGMGADVVFTRDDDTFVPLETRTAVANKAEADLFISVHANSSRDPAARGLETYYLNFTSSADALEVAARENAVSEKSIHELQDLVKKIAMKEKIEESRELASDVQRSMVSGLGTKDHGLRDRGVKKAPFIVLIGANMPSILAEISFVSNPGDERKLQTPEYRQKIAESLYRGVQRYVSGLSGMKMASKSKVAEGQ